MSLEIAIQENTAAINALIAAISKGVPAPVAAVETPPEKSAEKPASTKRAKTAEPAAVTAEPTTPVEIGYETLRAAVLKCVKDKGRETAASILAKFEAAKLPDVAPEKYAELYAALQQAA